MALHSTIRIRGTQTASLLQEIRSLPAYLSGRLPDRHRLGHAFASAFAHGLYTRIHAAFMQKSTGGSDSTGERWKPLARSTIAARPLTLGERRSLAIGKPGGKGLLSASQLSLWKGIFRSNFLKLAPRIGDAQAKVQAAKIAWGVLKAQGTMTRIGTLGARKVPILINTGRLETSLQPGKLSGTEYSPPDEQVFVVQQGSVTLGSTVPYAKYVHAKRRLWPPVSKMSPWITAAAKEATENVVRNLDKLVR